MMRQDFSSALFLYDPRAGRPRRLRETLRFVASEVERALQRTTLGMGRSTHRALFVTLTYARNTKGRPCDVSALLKNIREWLRRSGEDMAPYLWVAELQKRGAIHYHLLLWLPRRLHLPRLDRRGWWRHGMTKVETARNPVGYLVKYASKFKDDLARFRKGTRLYGYGGLIEDVRRTVRCRFWPSWARKAREEQATAAFVEDLDREVAEQEREEAALLYAWFPDEYPAPEPRDEEAEWEAHVQRVQWEEFEERTCRAFLARGRSLFARTVGGFVDRLTGEFFRCPYRVEFNRGVVIVRPPRDEVAERAAEALRVAEWSAFRAEFESRELCRQEVCCAA